MAACVYCSGRSGKRACPALGGEICPPCCGKHRMADITCPPDCRWLHGLAIIRDRSTFTREQYFSACDRLMAFVDSPSNLEHRDSALELLAEDVPEGVQLGEWMVPVIRGFLAYADRDLSGQRAVDRFVTRFGHGLSNGERAALAALQDARASIFEVEAVAIGAGLTLRDRIHGERVEVREVSASGHLVRGDTLFAWLMRVDDHLELTGAAMSIPAQHVEPLLAVVNEELELARREREEAPARSYVGELADIVVVALAELMAAARPKYVTTHGEDLVFCEAHYAVEDVARVRAKLASHPTFDPQGDEGDDYVWLDRRPNKQLGGGPTVLGRVHHDTRTLVLETQSRERLERGRALLRRLVGKAIVHQADTFTDLEAKLRAPRPPRREPEIPPEVQAEVLGAYLREHYLTRWVREPIPALGGRTPRAAARSREGRAQVARLIDEAEHASAKLPGGDDPDLWNELRASLKISRRVHACHGLEYNAYRAPSPAEWLAADEEVRIAAVRAHHQDLSDSSDSRQHALIHVIVENQVATGEPPETAAALARLIAGGMSRHSAIHAVAAIVAEEMQAVVKAGRPYDREAMARRLEHLRPTAAT